MMSCSILIFHPYSFTSFLLFFFFNDTATTEIYTLSYTTLFRSFLTSPSISAPGGYFSTKTSHGLRMVCLRSIHPRSEEHTSELQSLRHLVCRLLLEKKKKKQTN